MHSRVHLAALLLSLPIAGARVAAQESWTAEQDHAEMLRQLGIVALRPGPSGRADAPNPANYDESIANPFPEWPDLLTMNDGTPVTSADKWSSERRPEIAAAFEREVGL
ncbi:MAG TPA: hypothetical protein VIC71_03885 [Gammaproteobacteria bacterium]|jgi:hypothetical protein